MGLFSSDVENIEIKFDQVQHYLFDCSFFFNVCLSGTSLSKAVIFILERAIRALKEHSESTQRAFREQSESIKIRVIHLEPLNTASFSMLNFLGWEAFFGRR